MDIDLLLLSILFSHMALVQQFSPLPGRPQCAQKKADSMVSKRKPGSTGASSPAPPYLQVPISVKDNWVNPVISARNWRHIPLYTPFSHPVYLQCTRMFKTFLKSISMAITWLLTTLIPTPLAQEGCSCFPMSVPYSPPA